MARSEALANVASGSAAALEIEALTAADIDAGLILSDSAGWNQTADDWAFFIASGRAVGLRDATRRLVATAAALPYGPTRGWISMVLVADDWRHRGLASRLVDACVASLRSLGLVPVLDATPAGAEVYRRIGFVDGFAFDRWERTVAPAADARASSSPPISGAALAPAGRGELDTIAALDRAASGVDRKALLDNFLSRAGTRAWLAADGRGFAIVRDGRRALQIGPVVASDANTAEDLLEAVNAASEGGRGARTFIDVPSGHEAVVAGLRRRGWTRQRSFVRMALDAAEPPACGAGSIVLAGPEFG